MTDRDYNVSMNVTADIVPEGVERGTDEWKQHESLWLKKPAFARFQGWDIWRYELAKGEVTEKKEMAQSLGRTCDNQSGSSAMVAFYGGLWVYEVNQSSSFTWRAFLPIAQIGKGADEYIMEYVDNGIAPLILGASGTIYMDSGELTDEEWKGSTGAI